MLQKIYKNTYLIREEEMYNKQRSYLFISDVHFDSVHCDHTLLKQHLDEALLKNAYIFIFGDFFDLMQGRFDPRSSKGDLNPKYKSNFYIDDVLNDAVDFLTPYKHLLAFYSPGNHETAIMKRYEIDLVGRICRDLEMCQGNYAGYIYQQISANSYDSGHRYKNILGYHHGFGGSSPVTRGVIATNRTSLYLPDCSIVLSGHTHDRWIVPITRYRVNEFGEKTDQQWHIKLGSYKGMDKDQNGWETERGFAPKAGAGIWYNFGMVGRELQYNLQFA